MCIEENWKYESTPAIPIQQVHLATKMSGTTTQVLYHFEIGCQQIESVGTRLSMICTPYNSARKCHQGDMSYLLPPKAYDIKPIMVNNS